MRYLLNLRCQIMRSTQLMTQCEAISEYANNAYHSFKWRFRTSVELSELGKPNAQNHRVAAGDVDSRFRPDGNSGAFCLLAAMSCRARIPVRLRRDDNSLVDHRTVATERRRIALKSRLARKGFPKVKTTRGLKPSRRVECPSLFCS